MLLEILKSLLNGLLSSKSTSSPKENKVAIGLDAFFADDKTGDDRRVKYSQDYTYEILENAKILLEKVNAVLSSLGIMSAVVNSGWRPPAVNSAIGGAKNSGHLIGKAVDLRDGDGSLHRSLAAKPELLRQHGLFLEDSSATKGWAHLDFVDRPDRPSRIFKP